MKVYLDYAASTPVDPKVVAAMNPYFTETYGNPNALHSFGQEASRAVFSAKRRIAESIGADYGEIVFTGSATESNNLALRGITQIVRRLTQKSVRVGPRSVCESLRPRLIVSAIEHESILETCRDLERDGVEVVHIPVSRDGIVDLKKLKAALNERTVLVSVMYANNEVGTVQPVSEISKIIRNFRESGIRNQELWKKDSKFIIHNSLFPLFHTDAVQAFQYLNCNVDKLGVDLMTLSAHKIYGPKGIGALYARNSKHEARNSKQIQNHKSLNPKPYPLNPIITGSGTDNVPYIVGFAKAVEIADKMRAKECKRIAGLRNYFWQKLAHERRSLALRARETRKRPHALEINGSMKNRLPNNLNIYFPGQKAHDLQIKLDLAGIAVSSGAACTARVSESSFVLRAMGLSNARASGSLRFSLGRQTNKQNIDRVTSVLIKLLK